MKQRMDDRGFTLIEVMAAMLILVLVCVAYSENQVGAIQLVKATRWRETAIMLAQQKMAETNFLVQTKGIEVVKDDDKGEFDQEKFDGYTWHIWKTKVPAPDFGALIGTTGSTEDGASAAPQAGFEGPMKMITDIWGKSIMELHLEVNWKEGEQQKSYTLMTHYMTSDVNAQIQGLVGAMTGGAGASGGESSSSGENP